MADRIPIGAKSTYQVRCAVCDQTYGNAVTHRCPFAGVDHANMHRETWRRIIELEKRLDALVEERSAEPSTQPQPQTKKEQ